MSQNWSGYFYRVIEGTNPEKELTKIAIRRVDYDQLTEPEITKILDELRTMLSSDKYRLRYLIDLFDEVLSVYINRTLEERVKQGGNPFVGMIIPKTEIEGNLRKLPQKKWIPV